jgi:enamine deaminase RidA (YjgF/YER057c/UK114 family)
MEAATPLRPPRIAVLANRLIVDGLVVDDATAVELVTRRAEAGDDPARLISDAIEIGARVLDREQTGAQADFVKAEFEKVSREVEQAFAEQARGVAEQLAAAFETHFSDGSSAAVQHRVRQVVDEVSRKSREDLVKQFSSADGSNPLAHFQRHVLHAMKHGAGQQEAALDRMRERLEKMQVEIARLHAEREKQLELAVEIERGTAKGRTFEEAVAEALDRIALAQGDDSEAVGDFKGTTRRTGDVLVGIEGCRGPARGSIVFEAKSARLSRRGAVEELDRARAERGADYAVLVVPTEDKLPAKMQPLREYNGDKLVVCFDPEDGSTLSLEVAYALARARVLMSRGEADGVDAGAIRETVERALGCLGKEQKIKQQLTGATTSIKNAYGLVEGLAAQVRTHLAQIDALLDAASADNHAE